jgi:hypothetical protein
VRTAVWQSCTQVLEKVLPPTQKDRSLLLLSFWVGLSDQLWLLLAWCISLAWLLDCYQDSSHCQGQGARRVASAYGLLDFRVILKISSLF